MLETEKALAKTFWCFLQFKCTPSHTFMWVLWVKNLVPFCSHLTIAPMPSIDLFHRKLHRQVPVTVPETPGRCWRGLPMAWVIKNAIPKIMVNFTWNLCVIVYSRFFHIWDWNHKLWIPKRRVVLARINTLVLFVPSKVTCSRCMFVACLPLGFVNILSAATSREISIWVTSVWMMAANASTLDNDWIPHWDFHPDCGLMV